MSFIITRECPLFRVGELLFYFVQGPTVAGYAGHRLPLMFWFTYPHLPRPSDPSTNGLPKTAYPFISFTPGLYVVCRFCYA